MGIASHVEIFFPGSTEALQTLLSVGLMEVHCTHPKALSVSIFTVIQHVFMLQKMSSKLESESRSVGHVGNLTHACRCLQDEATKIQVGERMTRKQLKQN